MNKKKLLIIIVCIICFVITAAVLTVNIFDIHFNFITYHSFEQDGYSFAFKGSSNVVRKVIIKKDSKKLGSFPFDSSADVFKTEGGYSAEFSDVNFDGVPDLMLPCAIDSDMDIHYSVFLSDGSENLIYDEKMMDLPNVKFDSEQKLIFTEQTFKEILEEGTATTPEFYVRRHVIAKHAFIDGNFITLAEKAIVYYSENDYCCYSVYEYDESYGGLKYVDEKWFDPEKLDEYPLEW